MLGDGIVLLYFLLWIALVIARSDQGPAQCCEMMGANLGRWSDRLVGVAVGERWASVKNHLRQCPAGWVVITGRGYIADTAGKKFANIC
jgi:hypothetical protein